MLRPVQVFHELPDAAVVFQIVFHGLGAPADLFVLFVLEFHPDAHGFFVRCGVLRG